MNSQKLWTKDFVLATLSGLFAAMVFYITMTMLARYAVATYHAGTGIAGLTAGIFVIGSAIGRLISGKYIGHGKRRATVLFTGLLFFVCCLAYLLPLNIILFLAVRFFHGMTFGAFHTALSTIVVDFIPTSRRGEGIGYFSLNFTVATAIGPLTGLYLTNHFTYFILFAVCAFFALLTLIFVSFVRIHEIPQPAEQENSPKAQPSLPSIFEKKALPLACVIFIMSLCYTGVTTFADSYTAQLNLTGTASLFFIVYGVVILIARPLTGKLLDQRGDNIVMIPAMLFYSISLLVFGGSNQAIWFLISAVLMALGYGNILNMGQAIAVNTAPPHRIGVATSTYFVFSDVGMGVGPLIMGLIAEWGGFSFMYLIEAAIVFMAILLYYILHGRYAGKLQEI